MNEEKRYMQVANEMNLFMIAESAGVVYWKPDGLKLYENLKKFIRKHHEDAGYLEVKSPSIVSPSLFEKSGHMEKYKDNMFMLNSSSESNYALRPMSCPNHILIYQSEKRSYRDLPLPIFEFGEVYRNEASGSLQVLFRQRQFCQDDSHVFVNEENLIKSLSDYIQMSRKVYKELGFEKVKYAISLRPEKRFGEDHLWDKAEDSLREACKLNGLEYKENPNDGAFYGPKLEMQVEDKLGRSWQLGVIQLDYVLPERFELEYVDSDNKVKRPIILHHAVLGSLERMIGILLESFGKDIPEFLKPVRGVILPVSEKAYEYSKLVHNEFDKKYYKLDASSESLGKRIKMWKQKGVKEIIVVGEKEMLEYQVSGKVVYNIS
jgi:threonyl-tRNA synthetase